MAMNQINAKKRVMKRAKGGSLKEDKNPAVSTKMLNEIVGRASTDEELQFLATSGSSF